MLLLMVATMVNAQNKPQIKLKHVEPLFWWVGMANPNLQILVHGKNIREFRVSINYPGVKIKSVESVDNPNYLFINLNISSMAKPGNLELHFQNDQQQFIYNYQLKAKKKRNKPGQKINGEDVIYLITPDRFANGNLANDSTDDTIEKANRKDENGRHGGDLKGILNHFDYLKDLGVTTLWLNPFLENDQPKYSYHGYGISDFYKTDSRLGTNADFKALVNKCHQHGMKVIMDQVFNHCGAGHWWMNDLPTKDWLNQWDKFTRSNFTTIVASDPHASASDYKLLTKGWFDTNLPDLNLANPLLATYLIQNSIWWIEHTQLDGIRMDTYPYPNQEVMGRWMKLLNQEYPGFFMVAETWAKRASYLSYWNNELPNRNGYKSHVNSVSDYPLYYSIIEAFGKKGDVYALYETLAEDFVYGNPYNNKVFNGNHDVDRLLALLDGNVDKLKLSMAFVLTTRGIPQIYYGDEILMKKRKPDGQLRQDFPGGWPNDQRNAFTQSGRTTQENKVFNYIRKILNWRKKSAAIHRGKLIHYQPLDNIYVYFRHTSAQNVMVVINNSNKNYPSFDLQRYRESLKGYHKGKEIITGKILQNLESIHLAGNTALIVELEK